MKYSLLENANKFMGRSVYEQTDLEAKTEEITEMIGDGEEVTIGLDGGGGLEGIERIDGEELEGEEEEIPMITVEDATRAIQLVLDGEAETAEEALAMVEPTEEGEGDELEGEEVGEMEYEEESVDPIADAAEGAEEVEEEVEVEGCGDKSEEQEEEEEKTYGESHSKFLKFSEKYLS